MANELQLRYRTESGDQISEPFGNGTNWSGTGKYVRAIGNGSGNGSGNRSWAAALW